MKVKSLEKEMFRNLAWNTVFVAALLMLMIIASVTRFTELEYREQNNVLVESVAVHMETYLDGVESILFDLDEVMGDKNLINPIEIQQYAEIMLKKS